ncbi:hypothetical protein [Amycolatopsis sp. WQ 127309]|uniref:hypothetical protein n=1 Tax=Amycolatopsis sp. WQ 127309 TaxID=2932773 RepID=UPI001FF1111B|nr:hypothetical protein [Amycolatopsis sp. WQ 127309]UOZ06039.1 hypothetical protein MUY22_45730 [Amycolatopsis sp. WQ 127309]
MAARRWFQREHDADAPELPGLRRLTVREWLRGRLTDHGRAKAACNALCEHDEKSAPCWICSVRYW